MITTAPFQVIEGGAEDMADLKPELVKNEEGQICMQLKLGPYEALLPLPERLAGASKEALRAFFDKVVPEMTKNLIAMRKKDRVKLRKKVNRG